MPPTNRLNPAAGDVPLPEDPREIEAALRAGRITWRLFPYYRIRYGERGAAFTRSDSAWLVTLCEHADAHARQQVEWLGSVLSNRGMPRWLLELHLEVLYRQLSRAVPAKTSSYESLVTRSRELREVRLGCIPEERFQQLSEDFAVNAGASSERWLLGTGRLLVAAVADEKAGEAHSVSQLADWLTDDARFDELRTQTVPEGLLALASGVTPERWTAAVRKTVDDARQEPS